MARVATLALAATILLSACQGALNWERETTQPPANRKVSTTDRYVVQAGDTLYAIAWRHGLDHRDLARWNGIGDGSYIRVGQTVRLRPNPAAVSAQPQSASKPENRANPTVAVAAQPAPRWLWPVAGPVRTEFKAATPNRTGLIISATLGEPVRAAAGGKVVYAGSGLIGYGKLVIVKHNETYLSAYGHNRELLVGEGDTVTRGAVIARVGEGPERQPGLHFEIRRNGKPVDPRSHLPPQ